MNESYKESFRLAAADGWRVWVDNSAVEVLSPKEAREIRQRLKLRGEGHKILTPRFRLHRQARRTSHLNQQPWIESLCKIGGSRLP